MPYNSLNTTEDNLKRDTDLDLGPLKHQTELDHNLTTPDDDV